MVDSLSAGIWRRSLRRLDCIQPNRLTQVLLDIIEESEDPVVGQVLDRHMKEYLR